MYVIKYKASRGIVVFHADHLRGHPDHMLFFFVIFNLTFYISSVG